MRPRLERPCLFSNLPLSSGLIRVNTLVLVLVLIAGIGAILWPAASSTAQSEQQGLGEMRAEPTTWVYDHTTQKGHRLANMRLGDKRTKAVNRVEVEEYVGQLTTRGPVGYSPAQIRHAYGFDKLDSDGRGQVIGIVDAFHYPTAAADLSKFIKTFGLKKMYGLPGRPPCTVAAGPHPCFEVVYAQGSQPGFDEGWAVESALDTQWAHSIAPGADILLVETATDLLIHLFDGVAQAPLLGATVVSMSWGASVGEVPFESITDHLFFDPTGVTFLASTGDTGNPGSYPAVSPYVIAVGGTRLRLDRNGDRKAAETAWSGSGGGISLYELEPGYQMDFPIPFTMNKRGYPDVAYNADPATGVAVYDSSGMAAQTGWLEVGGTSAGAPQWAGLIALANQSRLGGNLSSDNLFNSPLYKAARHDYSDNYFDIKSGSNGGCGSVCMAARGYDFVTGLGSPRADELVETLSEH